MKELNPFDQGLDLYDLCLDLWSEMVWSRRRRTLQIRQEFQEIGKSRRKTCCPQKGQGKKRGKELRVESLSKESKKGKEIRDPKKGLKILGMGKSSWRF